MKKTLFIDARTGGDFTLDALWSGLVSRLGKGNVVDWPPAAKRREDPLVLTGDVEKDYGAERRSLGFTGNGNDLNNWSLGDVQRAISSGEIERIFLDEREVSYELYLQTKARWRSVPVVVIAGHDRFWNSSVSKLNEYYGPNLEHIFMDNWRPEYDGAVGMSPMCYSTNFDHLWEYQRRDEFLNDKIYDVCFMGYNSNPARARLVERVAKLYPNQECLFVERRPNILDTFLPKKEYFKRIARSRVCINLNGAAECGKALRFYEIPYVGSFMLSEKFSGKQVHPFVEEVHCEYFSGEEMLLQKIERALDLSEIREGIARRGHLHANKFHTARARVDYIYEVLGGQTRAV